MGVTAAILSFLFLQIQGQEQFTFQQESITVPRLGKDICHFLTLPQK